MIKRFLGILYFSCFHLICFPLYGEKTSTDGDYIIGAEGLGDEAEKLHSELSSGDRVLVVRKDMDAVQNVFVADALALTPSVFVSPTGPRGRQTSFFIRGARAAENVVLMDGVPVNDPLSGQFDLADLLSDDVESIEIIPGSQSLAYGSDALGGVVSIKTQRGRGAPKASFRGEGGNYRTRHGHARFSGEEGPFEWSGSVSGYRSGRGSLVNKVHGNRQNDTYKNGTFSSHGSYALSPSWDMEAGVRYSDARLGTDDLVFNPHAGGYLPQAGAGTQTSQTLVTHGGTSASLFKDTLIQSLRASLSRTSRQNSSPVFETRSYGQRTDVSAHSEIQKFQGHRTAVGEFWGLESMKADSAHRRNHGGLFAQHTWNPREEGEISGGVRLEHYEGTGVPLTYRLGASYLWEENTRFRTSLGTGFKAPLLSDLYQKTPWSLPNPHLKPEKSIGMDGGIDHRFWGERAILNLTLFLTHIKRVFDSEQRDGKWIKVNRSRRRVWGMEGALSLKPLEGVTLKETLTFTHSRDHDRNQSVRSPLIPYVKTSSEIHVRPEKDVDLFLTLLQVGARIDGTTGKKLPAYALVTVGGSFDLTKAVQVFGRVENVGNKIYENSFGYGGRGRTYLMGLEAKL